MLSPKRIYQYDGAGVKPLLVTSAEPNSNSGVGMWQCSGCLSKVGSFRRVLQFPPPHKSTNANIRAFENAFICSMRFLCNRSKINNVYNFFSPKRPLLVQEKDYDTITMRVKTVNQIVFGIYSLRRIHGTVFYDTRFSDLSHPSQINKIAVV